MSSTVNKIKQKSYFRDRFKYLKNNLPAAAEHYHNTESFDTAFSKPGISGNKVALITGATSGIGKAFADELARRHYDLIITGRRKEVIDCTADELKRNHQVSVKVVIADFSIEEEVDQLLRIIEKEPNLEVLVNNAGYGTNKIFHNDDIDRQLEMLKVHVTTPVMLIHKVLPIMISRHKGTIINVSSMAAFFPTDNNIMYASTKSFFLNFSESLSMEVKKYGIQLQCLCPGFTNTDFHMKKGMNEGPKMKSLLGWQEPSEVVRYSLHQLENRKVLCVPGAMNRLIVALLPMVPRKLYYYLSDRLDHDTGTDTVKSDSRVHGKPQMI